MDLILGKSGLITRSVCFFITWQNHIACFSAYELYERRIGHSWDGGQMRKWISDLLHVPSDVTSGVPRIEVIGYHQIQVENFKQLEQFNGNEIKLKIKDGSLVVTGDNLKIKTIYPQFIFIVGTIEEIRYI